MYTTTNGNRFNLLDLADDLEVHPTGILSRLFATGAPTQHVLNRHREFLIASLRVANTLLAESGCPFI